MKSIALALSLVALALPAASATTAEIKQAARKVHESKASSIFGLRGVLKIKASMNGQPGGEQETEIWNNGLMVADGLFITAYEAINPDFSSQKRPGLEIETKIGELDIVDASGEEYDAKLILHDEDLGVAFIALDPDGEKFGDFKGGAVSTEGDPELGLLDEIVAVGRYSSSLRFNTSLRVAEVTGIVKRPRLKYLVSGIGVGQAAFTPDGSLLGLTVPHSTPGKKNKAPVVLPVKYIRELLPQAKDKQSALAETGDKAAE